MANIINGKTIKKLLSKGGQSSRIEPGLYKFASQEDERVAHRLESFLWSLLHEKASIAAFNTKEQLNSATPSPQSTPLAPRPSVARTASAPLPTSVGRAKPPTVSSSAPCSSIEDTNAGRALHISDACKRFINNIKIILL
ncbi:hypothetical protein FHG87_009375 [Trinorchestia longiramus]|nr:hypothetical protein FHG87_009375 [Trinorchestia longiramus]